MPVVVSVVLAVLALPFAVATPTGTARRPAFLQSKVAPVFASPHGTPLDLEGFCKRDDNKPACTKKGCCCWSTFAQDKHPTYPTPTESENKRECLNPPKGFTYTAEPGSTFDDGYMETLKKANLPVFSGRSLCCVRSIDGVNQESQRSLKQAVKTAPMTAAPPTPDMVAAFTTQAPQKQVYLKSGDEFETGQLENAARAHLAAAKSIAKAAIALNASATAIQQVNHELNTDPNLIRTREHVKQMKGAIKAWSVRRWANLKRLETGDASAFDDAPQAATSLYEGSNSNSFQ